RQMGILPYVKGFGPLRDGIQSLAHLAGLLPVIVIDQGQIHIGYFAAKRISQHDELHKREDHRGHHERGTAEKFSHVALDDCEDSVKLHSGTPAAASFSRIGSRWSPSVTCRPSLVK